MSVTRFSNNQQDSATAAFGLFNLDQARHIFSRSHGAGFEPRVLEVAPRTWFIQPGMVNVALFETDEGLLLVDAGCAGDGPALLKAVRSVSDKPLHTVVYTHAHSDHAYGTWAFVEAGERPRVIAHALFPAHVDRYIRTTGLNANINGQAATEDGHRWLASREEVVWPTDLVADEQVDGLEIQVGSETFVVYPGKGETDDAVWVWSPQRRVIAAGDLVTGYFPNAGNPKKVQRYAEEWAEAAERMAALRPVAIIPGHGDPVAGEAELADELTAISASLRHVVEHAINGLNAGVLPDDIVATLEMPADLANHPRLPTLYDTPQYVCRNVIRRYGGWWSGYPSDLQPADRRATARAVAELAGGVAALVERARTTDDERVATQLAEWAFLADPHDEQAQACYDEILEARARANGSLMTQVNLRVGRGWVDLARRGQPSPAVPETRD